MIIILGWQDEWWVMLGHMVWPQRGLAQFRPTVQVTMMSDDTYADLVSGVNHVLLAEEVWRSENETRHYVAGAGSSRSDIARLLVEGADQWQHVVTPVPPLECAVLPDTLHSFRDAPTPYLYPIIHAPAR